MFGLVFNLGAAGKKTEACVALLQLTGGYLLGDCVGGRVTLLLESLR